MAHSAENGLIMVGVDGSEESRTALRWAVDQAAREGSAVEAVLVYEPMPSTTWLAGTYPIPYEPDETWRQEAERRLREAVAATVGEGGPEVAQLVTSGSAPRALAEASERADLLVLGSRQAHGFGRLLGSTATACIRHARCPVVVVPGDLHAAPPAELTTT